MLFQKHINGTLNQHMSSNTNNRFSIAFLKVTLLLGSAIVVQLIQAHMFGYYRKAHTAYVQAPERR